MDCADRLAVFGLVYPFAAAVFADVAAALAVRLAVMRADGQLEGIENGLTARLPIFAFKQNDEIVAANVADKVAVEVAMPDQYMSSHLDDVIPTTIAVDVVKRLEVIEVGVAGAECDSALQQPFDVFVDRDIAGQQSERICITGGVRRRRARGRRAGGGGGGRRGRSRRRGAGARARRGARGGPRRGGDQRG